MGGVLRPEGVMVIKTQLGQILTAQGDLTVHELGVIRAVNSRLAYPLDGGILRCDDVPVLIECLAKIRQPTERNAVLQVLSHALANAYTYPASLQSEHYSVLHRTLANDPNCIPETLRLMRELSYFANGREQMTASDIHRMLAKIVVRPVLSDVIAAALDVLTNLASRGMHEVAVHNALNELDMFALFVEADRQDYVVQQHWFGLLTTLMTYSDWTAVLTDRQRRHFFEVLQIMIPFASLSSVETILSRLCDVTEPLDRDTGVEIIEAELVEKLVARYPEIPDESRHQFTKLVNNVLLTAPDPVGAADPRTNLIHALTRDGCESLVFDIKQLPALNCQGAAITASRLDSQLATVSGARSRAL